MLLLLLTFNTSLSPPLYLSISLLYVDFYLRYCINPSSRKKTRETRNERGQEKERNDVANCYIVDDNERKTLPFLAYYSFVRSSDVV